MPKLLRFSPRRTQALEFERLVRPHVEALYRLAFRFTGVRADAEDLVQDTLIKLYPRTEELKQIEQLRPWLARVLYRQFLNFIRSRSRTAGAVAASADDDSDPLDHLPSDDAGPEEQTERSLQQIHILRALGRLGPDHRAVVVLHDIEGYRLEELEALLQTPLGTVKSRLHRARRQLRALLGMEPFAAQECVSDEVRQ